jgi:hypothetical protein
MLALFLSWSTNKSMRTIPLWAIVQLLAFVFVPSLCSGAENWESELPRATEARRIVLNRCHAYAKEVVHETREGVSSVLLQVEGTHAFQDIFLDTDMGGFTLAKPWAWPLGPLAVEADSAMFGDKKYNVSQLPIVQFNRDAKPVFREEARSNIALIYRRESTPDEESHGVYGRTVSVLDRTTQKVLGERTEFFWLSPPGFRYGNRQRNAVCPSLATHQKSPSYFIWKVIIPSLAKCVQEHSDADSKSNSAMFTIIGEPHTAWVARASPHIQDKRDSSAKMSRCYREVAAALPPPP